MTLDQAVEDLLLHAPVLLLPAHIARVLGVERPTLNRALANEPTAPGPANPGADGKPLYDARTVLTWWPTRRHRGRPPRSKDA
ncbi:hypothetical protein [Streptomyces sp. NPDC059783]|uniref:hypothetical protein n=1 Tax=Streptomyces sp. NPDC059783 TaxID=3346944 RepID=UPI00365E76FA